MPKAKGASAKTKVRKRKVQDVQTTPKAKGIVKKRTPRGAARAKAPLPDLWAPADQLRAPARANPDGSVPSSIFQYSKTDRAYQGPRSTTRNKLRQTKYGPGEGLRTGTGRSKAASTEQVDLLEHLTGDRAIPDFKSSQVHEERLTQYSPKHQTYVDDAREVGRPLTIQEEQAAATGKNADDASINHVIASGVGQNTMNAGIISSLKAQSNVDNIDALKTDNWPENDPRQKKVLAGLAARAAAVGRQQIYSRAITNERGPSLGAKKATGDGRLGLRNDLLKQTVKVMDPKATADPDERMKAYKSVLGKTFDSPGNLRVGDSSINTSVSTGFDAELDSTGQPTPRTERLYNAHMAAKPDHDEDVFTSFPGSGDRLSSSKQVKPAAAEPSGPVKASADVAKLWQLEQETDIEIDTPEAGAPEPTVELRPGEVPAELDEMSTGELALEQLPVLDLAPEDLPPEDLPAAGFQMEEQTEVEEAEVVPRVPRKRRRDVDGKRQAKRRRISPQ